MRRLTWLLSLAASLSCLASCGHGPILNVCASDPALSQFECSKPKTIFHKPKSTVLPYAASSGYFVYPVDSARAVLDYCAARAVASTQAPVFVVCESSPKQGGLNCQLESCKLIPQGQGISCAPGGPEYFVPYSSTENWVGLSPLDNGTFFAYCNISVALVQ